MKSVLIVALAAAAAASSGEATVRPTLALADRTPVTISLQGFQPRELVKVTLLDESIVRKTVLTTSGGRGFARFRGEYRDQCANVRAVATGNKGSRARMTVPDFGCPPVAP